MTHFVVAHLYGLQDGAHQTRTCAIRSVFQLVPVRLSDIALVATGEWIRSALEFEDFAVGKRKPCQRQVCILQHALVVVWRSVFLCSLASANDVVIVHPVRVRVSIAVEKIARYHHSYISIRRQVWAVEPCI